MKYFALAMGLLYVAFGGALLFSDVLVRIVPRYRAPLGALFMVYGAVRLVMWYRKQTAARNEQV